jgi:hypothetical protein
MIKGTVQFSVARKWRTAGCRMLEIFSFPSGDNGEDEMFFEDML